MTTQDFSASDRDYPALRDDMVDSQLARRGIGDARVLDAFRTVPREVFVPKIYRDAAYSDQVLPIGGGQTISQPYVLAMICQSLGLRGGERVLEIGTGSGYSSAVLARLAGEVITLDRDPELVDGAVAALNEAGVSTVTVLARDGTAGCAEYAPFDAIAVHALAAELPDAYEEQLVPGGRVVAPVSGSVGDRLVVFTKTAEGLQSRSLDAVQFVPLVSGVAGAE